MYFSNLNVTFWQAVFVVVLICILAGWKLIDIIHLLYDYSML